MRAVRYYGCLQRSVLTLALFAVFALGPSPSAIAQPANPSQRQGTNYDPPPPVRRQPLPPPPVEPEADKPLVQLQKLDWTDRDTWVKMALLVGSVLLARRAFREMKDDY